MARLLVIVNTGSAALGLNSGQCLAFLRLMLQGSDTGRGQEGLPPSFPMYSVRVFSLHLNHQVWPQLEMGHWTDEFLRGLASWVLLTCSGFN